MKTKQILAAVLSAALVITSAAVPVLADEDAGEYITPETDESLVELTAVTEQLGQNIESETTVCKLVMNEGTDGENILYYDSILDAINDTQFEECTGTIYMLKDEKITEEKYKNKSYVPYIYNSIKITSIDPDNPCTINAGKRQDPLLYMSKKTFDVNVTLENIIIDGDSENGTKRRASLIDVGKDTTLNLNTGAIVQNSHVSTSFTYGAAMMIRGGGTVNMNKGSKITGCTLDTYSALGSSPFGAIYLSSGTFTMNGGEISNNRTTQPTSFGRPMTMGGGGALFMNGGTFVMHDGVITGNSAYNGGAIFMNRDATFEMTGGTITGNTADAYVGGIVVAPTRNKVKLSGNCVITGNTSDGGRRGDNLYMDGNNTGDGLFADLYAGNFEEGAQVDLYTYMWSSEEVLDNEDHPIVKPLETLETLTEKDLAVFHSEDPVIGLKLGGKGNLLATKCEDGDITVVDTDSILGTEVTLNALSENKNVVSDEEGATYEVVLKKAPDDDAKAVEQKINDENDTNTEKAVFDVRVKKTTDSGEVSYVEEGLKNQLIIITLPQEPQTTGSGSKVQGVNVYHVDGTTNEVELMEVRKVEGRQVVFFAPSFSTYAVTYSPKSPLVTDNITEQIGVVYKKINDSKYELYLKATDDDKTIHRYMSAELEFALSGDVKSYDIEPADYMAASRTESDKWHFEMDGSGNSYVTGTPIKLGTITFYGHGDFTFKVKEAADGADSIDVVHTAKIADNIVSDYIANGDTEGTLLLNESGMGKHLSIGELAEIEGAITVPTRDLTVKITFPNEVEEQTAKYTDMQVTISGLLLGEPTVIDLGNDKSDDVTYTKAKVGDSPSYAMYSFTKTLPKGRYTVTFSGKGYRTFSHDVLVDDNKTMTVWNNVMDESGAVIVDSEDEKDQLDVTFLAGDIVEDNNINLYDLSAVVAYFGKKNDTENTGEDGSLIDKDYIKYDLNRDGVVDSKDIAMVLVSWNN